jgi:hypothetical protein
MTPKRLKIGIHNINKSRLKILYLVPEMVVAIKKNEIFAIFLLWILKNCSRRTKHKKYVADGAKDRIFWNSINKNQLFISNGSGVIHFLMKPCNPAFLPKKWQIKSDDR